MRTLIVSLYVLGAAGLLLVAWLSHREDSPPRARAIGADRPDGADPERAVGVAQRRRVPTIPRFSDIAGFVMAYRVGRVPVGRIAILGFWWWVGWHFFAR